jgi:1-acyl-sn-glycerol-3-phosphate acyltransferase
MIAAKTGAPIVPVRIFGSFEALPKSRRRISCFGVTAVVGAPLVLEIVRSDGRPDYLQGSNEVIAALSRIEMPPR